MSIHNAPENWPSVAIILVNWNGLADTLECLDSLSRVTYPSFQILVVDNGSTGNDASTLNTAYPPDGSLAVEVLETGANLGFTGGNNFAISHAQNQGADYILCLNNDTVVDPGFLEPLVGALEDNKNAALAVSKIYLFDEPEAVWYAGAQFAENTEALRQNGIAWHLPEAECETSETPFPTQIATGCALLIRVGSLAELGVFDDRFFAYFEDVDLSLRAQRLGLLRLVVPASRIWHKESRSSGGRLSTTAMFYSARNGRMLVDSYFSDSRRERRKFYHQFIRHFLAVAWGELSSGRHQRAQAALSGVLCGYFRWYKRRQDHPFADRIAAVLVWVIAPFGRVYWSLDTHVFRKLRRSAQIV